MSCLRVQPKPIQKAALPLLPEAEAGGCRSFEVLRRLEEKSKEKTAAVGFSLGQLLCKVRRVDDAMVQFMNANGSNSQSLAGLAGPGLQDIFMATAMASIHLEKVSP